MVSSDPATARKAPCRAKDPHTCPYHGAVLRMEEAAQKGDLDAYFEARQQVENAEKVGWDDEKLKDSNYEYGDGLHKNLTLQQLNEGLRIYNDQNSDKFAGDGMYAAFASSLQRGTFGGQTESKVSIPGVGIAKLVEAKWGKEDGGSHIWAIFEIGGRYFRLHGVYSSWDADTWEAEPEEIEYTRVIKTVVDSEIRIIQ